MSLVGHSFFQSEFVTLMKVSLSRLQWPESSLAMTCVLQVCYPISMARPVNSGQNQTAQKGVMLKVERSVSPKSMPQGLLGKSLLHWRQSLYILGFIKFNGFLFSWGRIFFWISSYLWGHQQAPFLKRFVVLIMIRRTKTCLDIKLHPW